MFFHLASVLEVSNDVFPTFDFPPYGHKETQKISDHCKTHFKTAT